MDRRITHSLIGTLLGALALTAGAATDGPLARGGSATSSGSVQVGLVVEEMVKLSDLNDLFMTWDAGQDAFVASDRVCVFRNISGAYSVTASSTAGQGEFLLEGDNGSAVPYDVRWNGQSLDADASSGVRTDADASATDCGGDGNVTLSVRASATQAGSASSKGSHTDTLVLQIMAE